MQEDALKIALFRVTTTRVMAQQEGYSMAHDTACHAMPWQCWEMPWQCWASSYGMDVAGWLLCYYYLFIF